MSTSADLSSTELPEYQIFSILRSGEEEPLGPFSQVEVLRLINSGEVSKYDLVYYEGMGEWRPIREVFEFDEAIANFEDDGQDQHVVAEIFVEMNKLISEDENIYYIAVQDRHGIRLKGPDAVVVTDFRLVIFRQKMMGSREAEMYYWDDIHNTGTKMNTTEGVGTFSLLLNSKERIEVNRLPRQQVQRLSQLARELRAEEAMH